MRYLPAYTLMVIGVCVSGCSDSPSADRPTIEEQNKVNSNDNRITTESASRAALRPAFQSFIEAGNAARWSDVVDMMTPAAHREFLFGFLMMLADREHTELITTKYKLREHEIDLFAGAESLWPHLENPGKVLLELLEGLDEEAAKRLMDHFPETQQATIEMVSEDRAVITWKSATTLEEAGPDSLEMKYADGAWYIDATTSQATVEIGGQKFPMEQKNGGWELSIGDPDTKKQPPMEVPEMTIPEQPVEGTVLGRPFQPDRATYNGTYLELRMGQEFFADASVKVFLFLHEESPAAKSFVVRGGDDFGSPHVHLSAKLDNDTQVPESDIVTDGYFMRLNFDPEENGEIPGRIFLQAPGERESRFAGTFRATMVTYGSSPAPDRGKE